MWINKYIFLSHNSLLNRFDNKFHLWLTFSHDSVECLFGRNQTSAKAGNSSAAVQIKLRLFFIQDTEIFCGASYLTIKGKQNISCVMFVMNVYAEYTFVLISFIVQTEEHQIPVSLSVKGHFSDLQLEFPT